MINEKMLLGHIQRPLTLGQNLFQLLQSKLQERKHRFILFLNESDNTIDACQRVGERVGRFLGWIVGLLCSFILVPAISLGILALARLVERGAVRWQHIQTWVDTATMTDSVSERPTLESSHSLFAQDRFTQDRFTQDNAIAGTMVALPPCDESSERVSLHKSIAFLQDAATTLPQTLTADGLKHAYHDVKQRTQKSPFLTGLVTAGFIVISFLAVQIDPAKEMAVKSPITDATIEDVMVYPRSSDSFDAD